MLRNLNSEHISSYLDDTVNAYGLHPWENTPFQLQYGAFTYMYSRNPYISTDLKGVISFTSGTHPISSL